MQRVGNAAFRTRCVEGWASPPDFKNRFQSELAIPRIVAETRFVGLCGYIPGDLFVCLVWALQILNWLQRTDDRYLGFWRTNDRNEVEDIAAYCSTRGGKFPLENKRSMNVQAR